MRIRRFIRDVGLVFAATLAAVSIQGAAFAAGLFNAAPQELAAAEAASELPLAAVRSRLVKVDLSELQKHVVPIGSDKAVDRIARAERLDGAVSIELFPGIVLDVQRTDVDTVGNSGIAWMGVNPDSPDSTVSLFIDNNQVTGTVEIDGDLYRIDPVRDGIHRITEIDTSALPFNEDDGVEPKNLPQPRGQLAPRSDFANTRIRVLVAYTSRAEAQSANIVDEIKLAISKANKSYSNTNIPIRLVLAGTMSAGSYNEGADTDPRWGRVLEDVSGQHGTTLQKVRNRRNTKSADLVVLVVRNSTLYCGLAWVVESPSAASSDYGFSEIAVGCLSGGIVLPHELGHNMGLRHDRKTDGGSYPKSKYNFGYINNNGHIISIMAYLSSCTSTCHYVRWFSTSEYTYNGKKLGIPKGTKNAADATRRLRETRAGIAAYR